MAGFSADAAYVHELAEFQLRTVIIVIFLMVPFSEILLSAGIIASLMLTRSSFSRLSMLLHITVPTSQWPLIMLGDFSLASALVKHNGTRIETVHMRLAALVLNLVDGDEFRLDLFFLLQQYLILLTRFHMVEKLQVRVYAVAHFA